MARRERQADFEDGSVLNASITRRPDAIVGTLYALAPGPRAVSDPSEGLLVKGWYVRVDNNLGYVYLGESNDLSHHGWRPETVLFSFTGAPMACIDLAFDQNGAPVVVSERSGEVWLRWYKPGTGYVYESIGSGVDPKCILDDPINEETSELLVFYKRAGEIRYRIQSELYAQEHDLGYALGANKYLQGTLRDRAHRVHLILAERDVGAGTWQTSRITSKLYPILAGPDGAQVSHRTVSGTIELVVLAKSMAVESLNLGHRVVDAKLVVVVWDEELLDPFNLDVQVEAVDVIPIVTRYDAMDEANVSHRAIAGAVTLVLRPYTCPAEAVDISNRSVSGTLVVV